MVARARYLQGAIAADRGDAAGVARTLAALADPARDELRADRLELVGRLRMLERDPAGALGPLRESADIRRDVLDYVGMARALALAGAAAEAAGRLAEAADLYLRAGRSAGAGGDPADARRWLEAAARLAAAADEAEILAQARERLDRLDRGREE